MGGLPGDAEAGCYLFESQSLVAQVARLFVALQVRRSSAFAHALNVVTPGVALKACLWSLAIENQRFAFCCSSQPAEKTRIPTVDSSSDCRRSRRSSARFPAM